MIAWAFAGIAGVQAETGDFALSAATINAGGNHASGGAFSVEGSIAQPVAGAALAGGSYQLDSGFQALDNDAIFIGDFE